MKETSRSQNSIRNTVYGITTQVLTVLISFITRTVFIKYLSVEYLGVNGLFTNILTILSLAELGFGSSVIYSMYKPLAQNDQKTIAGLMNFYSKVYKIIGFVIGVIGLSLIPALDYIIKDKPDIANLTLIYILFLGNSVSSYFFAYKGSIITADQKQYILSQNKLYFSIIKAMLQIGTLIVSKNFIIFLLVQIFCTLGENLFISLKADKLYPYLIENKKLELDVSARRVIWTNVKALMIYKIGSIALDGTDNIIISSFIGVAWIGKLSNYTLIVGSLTMIVQQFANAITASVGNFVAKENKERQEFLLKTITFANFIIYGFSFICLNMLLNPFIQLWIGTEYLLNAETAFIISLNWYIFGMMNSVWTFRSTMGLFVHGKYRPAVSAIINIVISILLAKYMGLIGVLLGTTITRVVTNVWYDPLIVYKYGLQKSVRGYYLDWLKYLLVVFCDIGLLSFIFGFLPDLSIIVFIIQMTLCVLVIPLTFVVIFGRTKEFKYLLNAIKAVISTSKLARFIM